MLGQNYIVMTLLRLAEVHEVFGTPLLSAATRVHLGDSGGDYPCLKVTPFAAEWFHVVVNDPFSELPCAYAID